MSCVCGETAAARSLPNDETPATQEQGNRRAWGKGLTAARRWPTATTRWPAAEPPGCDRSHALGGLRWIGVDVIELGALNDAQQAELEEGDVDPWGAAANTLRWRPKDLHVALRQPDGRLVASAGLVLAEIQVGDAPPMQVAGLGGVIVSASYRGQGLGNRVIREALRRATTLGPGAAMLFCDRDRAGLYERHEFLEIDPPVMVQQPHGFLEMPLVAMWRPLREGVTLPSGPLTVHGLPF